MTAEEIERFRISILQQLRAADGGSLPVPTLATGARLAGFTAAEPQVRGALAYLCDKGFAAPVEKMLSPENKRYRITAAGSDFLAEANL